MNENKICFIICTNNEIMLNECMAYINRLIVPSGYEIDAITVSEAESMTSGYNEAMNASDAKYKIYMHQDVYIINQNFLEDILSIFKMSSDIGAIGLVGYKYFNESYCMWKSPRYGLKSTWGSDSNEYAYSDMQKCCLKKEDRIEDVIAVDGLLIATSKDVEWDDEFDGWDFYDASQSIRFWMSGYRVVVPEQQIPWIIHDEGKYLSMWNYGKYYKKFAEKYGEEVNKYEKRIKN